MPSKDAAVPAELYSLVHAFLTANDQSKSAKSLKKAVDAKVRLLWDPGLLLLTVRVGCALIRTARVQIEDVKGPDLMAIYDTHLAETGCGPLGPSLLSASRLCRREA